MLDEGAVAFAKPGLDIGCQCVSCDIKMSGILQEKLT